MSVSKAPKPCHRVIYNNLKKLNKPFLITINWGALGYEDLPNDWITYKEEEILDCLMSLQRSKDG